MSAQEAVLQVVIFRDGALVGTEVFPPGAYRVGSAVSNELRLEHPSVDVQHAVLYFKNGKAVIQDNSRGGIFVNGQRVSVSEIRPIDEIRCGAFVLKARIAAQGAAATGSTPPEVEALLGGHGTGATPSPPASPARGGAGVAASRAANAVPSRQKAAAPAELEEAGVAVSHPPARPKSAPLNARASQNAERRHPVARESVQRDPKPRGAAQKSVAQPQPARAEARQPVARDVVPKALSPRLPQSAAAAVQRSPVRNDAHSAPDQRGMHLNLELYWGDLRRGAYNFGPSKKPVVASDSETAQMPLWGFTLPNGSFNLAQSLEQGFRLYVPPRARIEKRRPDGRFHPIAPGDLEADATGQFISLSNGMEARFVEGLMSLYAFVAPRPPRVRINPFRGLPWFLIVLITLLGSGLGYFIRYGPKPPDVAEFAPKNLPPVAVRLITPLKKRELKKKEAEKPKEVAEKKEEKKEEKPVVKEERRRPVRTRVTARPVREEKVVPAPPPEPPPESKALKALAKLSAAGPATGEILAAVDKLGSGPGSRKAKNSNYKLSGLIGKAPIANAGVGTFGLGGGGKGGGGTLGAELLRGRGGGGIGALGLRGIGRGTVAGTVTRASARTISAQGSVDREAVAKTVNAHLQEVRGCYERALIKEPALAGKVVLEWTISTNGSVVSAKIKSSTLRNSTVEGCILQDLKTWKFPPAKGGLVIVSYPFLFNSVGY